MEQPDRRLITIVSADVVGYSRLMSEDEERTFVRIHKFLDEIVFPTSKLHQGRIVKTMGDGFLAEFGSVVRAIEFAAAIQEQRAASDPELHLRVGIHLGDVIHKDGDVFGEGVNIAARLQELAEPDSIVVSRAVRDHARPRFAFDEIGEKQLKNIARPVRTFRLAANPVAKALVPKRKGWSTPAAFVLALAAVVLLGVTAFERLSRLAVSVPARPAVAVLPFANVSSDPSEEYFSDGITEDILTALSKFPELLVIARNSSFQFKNKSADTRKIGSELGVGWVVEGSVRRDGQRIRITAQLVDAATGLQRWAERYDRELTGLFEVQDQVAEQIVTTLVSRITKAEVERIHRKPPERWEAYDYYLRATDKFRAASDSRKGEDFLEVRRLIEAGLSLDPNYAPLHALSASADIPIYREPILPKEWRKPETLAKVFESAAKAVQLDPTLPAAHAVIGTALFLQGRTDDALADYKKVFDLNPSFASGVYADILAYAGRPEEALEAAERAMRLDPLFPANYWFYLGHAQFVGRRYDEALKSLLECDRRIEFRPCDVWLSALYAHRGELDKARHYAGEVLKHEPGFRLSTTGARMGRQYSRQEDLDHFIGGLKTAGLPE